MVLKYKSRYSVESRKVRQRATKSSALDCEEPETCLKELLFLEEAEEDEEDDEDDEEDEEDEKLPKDIFEKSMPNKRNGFASLFTFDKLLMLMTDICCSNTRLEL
jgi:hypothetical protein